jgi:hypothetical protein
VKFAKAVFWIAGALGLLAAGGLYFQPGTYIYYGLIAGVLAWQVVFFLIAWDPHRYRPIMIPAMLEKLIWVVTLGYLHLRGQVTASQLASGGIPHGLLGVLFVIAYIRMPKQETKA